METISIFGLEGNILYNKYKIKNFVIQQNNTEYSSCEFIAGNKNVTFRKCKMTPKK
jgi:hypothetical protein